MNGYTQADNWLWDYVMPKAKPNTFKIVSAVVRMTDGWHRDEAEMTFDDFQDMTGIASRATLNRAIQDALDQGFIVRAESGRGHVYSTKTVLISSTEMVLEESESVPELYQEQYRNGTDDSTETVPSTSGPKESLNKPKEKTPAAANGHGPPKVQEDAYLVVRKAYEQEIHQITRLVGDKLRAYLEEFSPEAIVDAIHEASLNDVRKWKYIEAILERWKVEGRGGKAKRVEKEITLLDDDGNPFKKVIVNARA